MPFNGSGTFTIVNTFVPNTTILSSAVNANFTDIATGLSDCLTRDNQAGMTAVFRAVSGSVSAPGITFNSDTTSGFYLSASGAPGFVSHSLGMILNTNYFSATAATPSAGGSGYVVGDTITATGGTAISQPVFQVATLSGSAVATVTVAYPGFYSATPANPVAQGSTSGVGTGCTLTVTYNNPAGADYRALFTDQAAALIWSKFGASSFMSTLMEKATAYDVTRTLVQAGAGITIDPTTTPPTFSAPATPYQGGFKNLVIKVATNTTVTVAADAEILTDGTNYRNVAPSSTINLGTNGGVNALDTGTIAQATWYYIWVIAQTVVGGTVACLASLSSTAPTMPTGYTYKARVGAVRTAAASAQLLGSWQFGRRAQYVVGLAQCSFLPTILSGTSGTYSATAPTWAAQSVSNVVPTTASEIFIVASNNRRATGQTAFQVAPNNSYSGYESSTDNVPPIDTGAGTTQGAFSASIIMESTNIYAAGTGIINTLGWIDNL